MSIPLNHHYVSQCQIKNFFNQEEGKIYLYDKELDNFFSKTTTKSVFSEKGSNSKVTKGDIDHLSLELELKNSFEDSFTQSFNELDKAVRGLNEKTNLYDHLIKLTKYGIAGDIRNPNHKASVDQAINEALFERILPIAAPELKGELELLRNTLSMTKYSNQVSYIKFAEAVYEAMGEVWFEVYFITDDCVFILPDRPSLTQRENINSHPNPDISEIAIVDVPLSSKMILHTKSKKLGDGKNQVYKLNKKNKSFIDALNIFMLESSYKQVACESKNYLQELVNKASAQK